MIYYQIQRQLPSPVWYDRLIQEEEAVSNLRGIRKISSMPFVHAKGDEFEPRVVQEYISELDGEFTCGVYTNGSQKRAVIIRRKLVGDHTGYGEIVDNYVNITYELHFDNSESSEDREIDWEFGIQKDILLSNLSIILGEKTYYGVVKPVLVAEQEYNESVEANETAVLMKQTSDGYSLQCNLEAETEAHVFITLE